jgi:hypothetical protein
MEMPEGRGQVIQLGLKPWRIGSVYIPPGDRVLQILERVLFALGIAVIPYVVLRANVNVFGQESK